MTDLPLDDDSQQLLDQARLGNRRAIARLLTHLETGGPQGQALLAALLPQVGQAYVIGFTGPPGAGKSTLIARTARLLRERAAPIAVVAVDPTSPLSGGALLGDRLRMRELVSDSDFFIRSMASRGHPGGIAHATQDVVMALDALGFPLILVETVGAGQAQVDVAQFAHTVVLVEAPGMGDEIQALKAGLTEIADIIVVNKADRPDVKRTVQAIRAALLGTVRAGEGLHHPPADALDIPQAEGGWVVPVLEVSALNGQGLDELISALALHRDYLVTHHRWETHHRRWVRSQIETWLQRRIWALVQTHLDKGALDHAVAAVMAQETDFTAVAQALLEDILKRLRSSD